MDWRVVQGWDAYEVSSTGAVRRAKPPRGKRAGNVLTPYVDRQGYHIVHMRQDGRNASLRVHRLVCMAFIGPPPNQKDQVAHFDGDPSNNNVSNLRWASLTENQNDKKRHKRWNSGERQGISKLTDEMVRTIFEEYTGKRGQITNFARRYGVSVSAVWVIIQGRTWRHIAANLKSGESA